MIERKGPSTISGHQQPGCALGLKPNVPNKENDSLGDLIQDTEPEIRPAHCPFIQKKKNSERAVLFYFHEILNIYYNINIYFMIQFP